MNWLMSMKGKKRMDGMVEQQTQPYLPSLGTAAVSAPLVVEVPGMTVAAAAVVD